ncbi:UNVERIFIED_CONTAM: hypothetical protein GTU68_003654 [Idotea baltica]|nr:hypothetical protein [Idotea baltica]
MSTLELRSVTKRYKKDTVVDNVSFNIADGETLVLFGPSGAGKTVLLRVIAGVVELDEGFEEVSSGTISIGGKLVNKLAPVKRNVAMAFEGYSLYPPLTIRDNIAFALKATKLNVSEVAKKVTHVSEMLEIDNILDRYPSSVSGGEQQRASLARALVRDADLHLLDEPMGQLEPQLRALLRGRIKHYIKEKGLTAILVTHDQAEANALSDRIAVMEGGYLQQFESPLAIKERPANLFTGTFIGEPPMNVFNANVVQDGNKILFELDENVVLAYDMNDFSEPVVGAALSSSSVVVGVRPYAVKRSDAGVDVRVITNQWLGDQTHIAAMLAGQPLVLVEHDRALDKIGNNIAVRLAPESSFCCRATGVAISHGMEWQMMNNHGLIGTSVINLLHLI